MNRAPLLSTTMLSRTVAFGSMVLALTAPILGIGYLLNERAEILRERSQELTALGRLRIDQVQTWFDERMQDARFAQVNGEIAANADRWASGRIRPSVPDWMRSMLGNGHYRAIQMFAPDGRLLASIPERHALEHLDSSKLRQALASRTVLVDDLRRFSGGDVRMHLYAPLLDPRSPGTADPKGVVIFDIDPEDRLFPIARSWPVPSRSARSILYRVAGDSVEFLDPQLRPDLEPMSFRLPIELPDLPAAGGVRGYEGVLDGVDYRGEPVIAYVAPIRGVNWWMVSKIDRAEVLARWQDERTIVSVGTLFATLLAVTMVMLTRRWAAQQLSEERTRHRSELDAIRQHQAEITDLANDIVILSDGVDRILRVNRMASIVYGMDAEQLVGRSVASLRVDGASEAYQQSFARLSRRGQLRYHAQHRGANGRQIEVEVAARHLVIDGQTYIQRIIRDITERVAYETELRRLNRMRSMLSGVNRVITRVQDEASMLTGVCSAAVSNGAFPLVWIGRTNEDRTEVIPVAAAGVAGPHASTIRIPLIPSPTSLGFDGTPLLSGTPIVIDDLERDVRSRPWRDDARTYGLRSAAIVPVHVNGHLWGVVAFAATEPSYCSREELELLREIATDIGFAVAVASSRRERADAENRLAEQQAIFRALFEHSGEAILLTHPSGSIFSMNPEALKMFGRNPDEVPRLRRDDLVDENDPRLAQALEVRQRTGVFCGELRLRRSDGTFFPGEVSSVVFRLANGEMRTSMTIRDVSSRRSAEKLMQSQLSELQRWHDLTLDRETRIIELKREVNALLRDQGHLERYPSVSVNGEAAYDHETLIARSRN